MRWIATATTLLALGCAATASAQTPDFQFGRPIKTVSVRGAWLMPHEGGDFFAFIHDQLTIDPGDFKAAAVAAELGAAITPRITLLVGVEASRTTVTSEYRKYIGSDGLPIAQRSQLMNVGINATVKIALTETGRRISRYAWIPGTVVPYVGAGGGAVRYRFDQVGEFVDFVDDSVFRSAFSSQGWGPSAHALAGADFRVWRSMYMSIEGRYVWAHAGVGGDFIGFDRVGLSGFRMASGVNVVF